MSRRPPSQPPALAGFEHIRLLGSGGFADVFLYQQLHPRRQVAVKVLLKERLGTDTAQGFTEEANLMAQLATHPSIVSVFGAGVADDGRPYLVMEYCSKPNLQARHRKERFSVAEALRIGIQISGAVEAAHRAGILHRDIKPANILVTDYGRPALTDFGISATTDAEFAGMSVPWSPPESFRMPPEGYPSSDVYSLAATLYTLLTNRMPFEIAGASNTEIDVISRIQTMALPPTGRSDAGSLEAVLAKAMAKQPSDRYATAVEFARALQRVQIERGTQATAPDIAEDDLVAHDEDDDDSETRFRGVTNITAQPTRPGTSAPTYAKPLVVPVAPIDERTVLRAPTALAPAPRVPDAPPLDDTLARPAPHASAPVLHAPPRRRGRIGWIAGTAVAVVAAIVVIALVLVPQSAPQPPATTPDADTPLDLVGESGAVPQIEGLQGTRDGADVAFTWTNPDPQNGDVYKWRPVVVGEQFTYQDADTPTARIAADASGRACIEVLLVRANGRAADAGTEGCAP